MTASDRERSDTHEVDFEDVVRALSDPQFYSSGIDNVDVRQTHASAVFIAGDDVYKLKKPVNFGFLDYSSLDRRRRMCHLEVRLNRRLASDVYLGVIELVWSEGCLHLGGPGSVVDYLVHMRRLPDDATLLARLRNDSVDERDLDLVARRIAAFHADAQRDQEIDRWGLPEAVSRNVEENFEQVEPYIGRTIPAGTYDRIARYAREFLSEQQSDFYDRVRAGRIRDGHGDLHAEHVYLVNGVEIIDSIEFNDRFRYGDVAVDVGFLAMDLDARNRPDLSDRLIKTYSEAAGDDLASVLDYYRCYRAYVRGKVTSFRIDEPSLSGEERVKCVAEARRYFHHAHRYAVGDRRPRLLVMSGVTGTGKSTLAEELAAVLPAAIIDSDSTRKQLVGVPLSSRQEPSFGTGIYSDEMHAKVYRAILNRAAPLLDRGQTVILDATYTRNDYRIEARELARRSGAAFLLVRCDAPEDEIRARLSHRREDPGRVSDGRWEIYLGQRDTYEPFDGFDASEVTVVDTTDFLNVQVENVLARLEQPAESTTGT